jgi:hypothetical protein
MLTAAEKEIVKKARDRIACPARWCQFASARDAHGFACKFDDPRARSHCAFGALELELAAAARAAEGARPSQRPDDLFPHTPDGASPAPSFLCARYTMHFLAVFSLI